MSACQQCQRPSSDNKFFNCPPRMADGRHFTDYRPRCYSQYMVGDKPMSSFEQRIYLTENAADIMMKNAAAAYVANRCGPCEEPFDQGTMLPEKVKQVCDSRTCTYAMNDPYGLGLGRQYIMSDEEQQFKAKFLAEKEKEQSYFKSEAVGSWDKDPMYYPVTGGSTTTAYDRFAVPSGAIPLSGGR